jgi:phosphomethylpyrimidine synthase
MRNASQTPLAVSVPPYPASEKVYVPGRLHPYLRVAMRKIHLSDPDYPAYYAYDTSGPYTDPQYQVDIRRGLPRLREGWIAARGDTEQLSRFSSPYAQKLYEERPLTMFPHPHLPRRAKPGRAVTQLAYAKAGIITP